MEDKKRNVAIDILKVLGIMLIILAHTKVNSIIFQLRNFDVILLVILSGILATNSYKKTNGFWEYIKKRFVRLVIPVWIFLTFFFIVGRIFIFKNDFYSLEEIINSYLMTSKNNIGYVWIFRVYILSAITVPFLLKIKEKYTNKGYYIFLAIMYLLYEILYYIIGDNIILEYILYYIIPYGICTGIGMQINNISNKGLLRTSIVFITIFIMILGGMYLIDNKIVSTNQYKYPPRAYYLSYAIGITFLIYYLLDRKNIFNLKERLNNKVTLFISSHTMWIYLWHILYTIIINKFIPNMIWFVQFVIVLTGAVATTYVQSIMAKKIKNKNIKAILDC